MGRNSRTSVAVVCVAAAGLCAAAAVTTFEPRGAPDLHDALRDLTAGRHRGAEQIASSLAARKADASPRAWLVVAAARQRQQRHADAADAYRRFLVACHNEHERRYVMRQILACRSAVRPAPRLQPPSRWLTAAEKTELAKVEEEFFTESSEHFIIRAKNKRLPKLLVAQSEQVLRRICNVVLRGQEFPHSVDIHVWPDRDAYLAHAADSPEWSGGSFHSSVRDGVVNRRIDLTQRDAEGRFADIMLDRVLPHEMCHLVIQEYFGDSICPLFLNEGLAMMAEYDPDPQRIVLAGAALTGGSRISLEDLFARSRDDLRDPAVFYAESYSLLSFLHARTGPEQFRRFLGHVKEGCTAADALQRALYSPDDPAFTRKLAAAWEDHAITDAKILRALSEQPERPAP